MDQNENKTVKQTEEKKMSFTDEVIDFAKTFVICLVSVWLLTTFVVTPVKVDGSSMYPTLVDQELGLSNIFAAKYLDVKRFDIVVVNDKKEDSDEHWVKRVIGLPGETISCIDDVVYIDGEPLEEPFLDTEHAESEKEIYGYFTNDFDEVVLGEDEYFLMGDNRTNSTDSRVVGAFKREDITCKGVFIYYPFNEIKIAK